jgi:hypothetical protein
MLGSRPREVNATSRDEPRGPVAQRIPGNLSPTDRPRITITDPARQALIEGGFRSGGLAVQASSLHHNHRHAQRKRKPL